MFVWDLAGELKPAVTEKYEIEYGDESTLLTQLG